MVDWIKGGRGIPSGPVWPFVKMWNKPYYNEGDMIAAMPGGISIIGTPGERITPIHDPWCGYWPLQVPFAYPWYPSIRWLSCPQAVLWSGDDIWFITTDQLTPVSTFWIQKCNLSTKDFITVYTDTLPNIPATQTAPAIKSWSEIEINVSIKGTKKVIVLFKRETEIPQLAGYVDVYVFDDETLQFHTKIMDDSSFVLPVYNSKYALIDSEDNIHILVYTYTDEILKAYDYRSTDGGETFTAYLVNDFDIKIALEGCFICSHIGKYLVEGLDSFGDPDGTLWALPSHITLVYEEPDNDGPQLCGLAEGTNSATLKTTNVITYHIYGEEYNFPITDNIVMTACETQPESTSCWYAVSVNASGNITVTKGTETSLLPVPVGDLIIGVFLIQTASSYTFTSGTTDLSATGITATFYDVDVQITNGRWIMLNNAQLFKSTNFGSTWIEQTAIDSNVITEGIRDFMVIDDVFYAIDTSGRYNEVDINGNPNPREVYIKRSTNGVNWTKVLMVDRINAELYLGMGVLGYDGTYYYAIMTFSNVSPAENMVYRSADGITWIIVSTFEGTVDPSGYRTQGNLAIKDDGKLTFTHWYADTWQGGYKQMCFWESEDNGETWTNIPCLFRNVT